MEIDAAREIEKALPFQRNSTAKLAAREAFIVDAVGRAPLLNRQLADTPECVREQLDRAAAALTKAERALSIDSHRPSTVSNSSAANLIATALDRRDVELHKRLRAEIALLEENLEDMSFGVYKPHYSFDAFSADPDTEHSQQTVRSIGPGATIEKSKAPVRPIGRVVCAVIWATMRTGKTARQAPLPLLNPSLPRLPSSTRDELP